MNHRVRVTHTKHDVPPERQRPLRKRLGDVERGDHTCPCVFFFNDTATTEIYTLSLHDALPISSPSSGSSSITCGKRPTPCSTKRSEEHTSELQSRLHLVCRLLLEKKKKHP